jgi:hypothetical protein
MREETQLQTLRTSKGNQGAVKDKLPRVERLPSKHEPRVQTPVLKKELPKLAQQEITELTSTKATEILNP